MGGGGVGRVSSEKNGSTYQLKKEEKKKKKKQKMLSLSLSIAAQTI